MSYLRTGIVVDISHSECNICYEKYDGNHHNPCVIACGHTFCRTCINKSDKCPVCQIPKGKTIENWELISILDISCEKEKREKSDNKLNFLTMSNTKLLEHMTSIVEEKKKFQEELLESAKHIILCHVCELLEKNKTNNNTVFSVKILDIFPDYQNLNQANRTHLKNFFLNSSIQTIKFNPKQFVDFGMYQPKLDIIIQNV